MYESDHLEMTRQWVYISLIITFYLSCLRGTRGLGENCTSSNDCRGPHVYCFLNSSVCECQERFNESDGLCKAALGSSCQLTACHDRYAMCTEDFICKCKYGYVQADDICKAIRGFECEGTECYDKLMSCDSESGQCDCKEDYNFRHQYCYPALGRDCSKLYACGNEYSTCSYTSYVCECLNGYVEKNGYCQAMLGSDCSSTNCFHGNALCRFYTRLGTSVCVCPDGFIQSGNFCLPGVGAECRTVEQCADEHAYCDTDSICKCDSGYTLSSGVCAKDSDTCSPDDCYHPAFRCSNINCACDFGFAQANNSCKAYYREPCGSGICLDAYASCSNVFGFCICTPSFIYDYQSRTCKPDIGVNCSERNCFSDNSFCNSDKVCECMPGYTQKALSESCVPDVVKDCSSIRLCSSGASCISGVCQCSESYGEINGYCYPRVGMNCGYSNLTCYGDHVSCYKQPMFYQSMSYYSFSYDYYCKCDAGYRQIGYTCLADLGRNCSRVPCASKSMRCSNNSVCICKEGFAEIDGTCRTESEISCSSDECIDDSSNCNLESNCSCPNRYELVHNKCKADSGSHCSKDEDCYISFYVYVYKHSFVAYDRSASCIDNICGCKPGYVRMGNNMQPGRYNYYRQCLPDVGSNCTIISYCYKAPSVLCSPSGICECVNDPNPSTDLCERGVGNLCGNVNDDDNGTCYDPNASCRNMSYIYTGFEFSVTGNVNTTGFVNVCICNNGFKQSGAICKADLGSSCTRAACYDRNAACINNVCVCKTGYIAINGICRDVEDICAGAGVKCDHICIWESNVTHCTCNQGYKLLDDNTTCTDINECAEGSSLNTCNPADGCINNNGSYECRCAIGHKLQNDRRTCLACDAYHYGVDCINECRCGPNQQCNSVAGCLCRTGWEGESCNVDIDECNRSLSLCNGTNTVCDNITGHYQCVCKVGYIRSNHTGECQACSGNTYGKDCSEDCICSVENVQVSSQACHHVDGSCVCKPQWTGSSCREDVNECQNGNICDNKENSECFNTVGGGYTCICQTGYTEKDDKCVNDREPTSDGTQLCFDLQFSLYFLIICILLF